MFVYMYNIYVCIYIYIYIFVDALDKYLHTETEEQ